MITQTSKMSVMFGKTCKPWILLVLLCRQVLSGITSHSQLLIHFVGENAHFRWSSDDNSTLFSATWGIRKGTIADPQFINVNILRNKINVNSDLKPDLISRLSYEGDLWKGRAWFVLKNVTVDDTNEYLASISKDAKRVLPYTIALVVKERDNSEKTEKHRANFIQGPTEIEGYIGKDAKFMWNTTDQREILSVSLGIRNGDMADPQFINVNGYTGRVSINIELDETLRKRVGFVGDLKKGRAWFVLKDLTVSDTNEYIASISDDFTRVLPYYVRLKVTEERKV